MSEDPSRRRGPMPTEEVPDAADAPDAPESAEARERGPAKPRPRKPSKKPAEAPAQDEPKPKKVRSSRAKRSGAVDRNGDGEDDQGRVVPDELALLPLRDSVVFPMLIAPLSVGRESSVRLLDETLAGPDRIIGVVTQREPSADEPGPDGVHGFGCAVIVRTLMKNPDGVRLIVQGISRFRILSFTQERPYLKARIETIEEPAVLAGEGGGEELDALRRSVAALFERAVDLSPNLPDELKSLTTAVQETNVMADLVAAHMSLDAETKQKVLETLDLRERLRFLVEALAREARVLELSNKVTTDVNAELSKNQREFYLREQLKAIRRELGEDDDRGEELEDLRRRWASVTMPKEAEREVTRELDRLGRMNPGAPEYTVARTYVETMLSLPWNEATTDDLDLKHARAQLDDDHFGLDKVKARILEFLAVRKVKTDGPVRQPILLLVGPPGVGKTSLGRSIADAMGRRYTRMSLGGMRDEAEIRGHRRTYVGAMPGQIIRSIRRVEMNNPVLVLDEVDKLGNDHRGDPSSALLEVLDPEQNSAFRDHYLDAPWDLSNVFFIATANRLDTIPAPLRDRMEVIEIGGYTEEEKVEIAMRHLVPKQIAEHGLKPRQIAFSRDAVTRLVRGYTREAGVRSLEREIAAVVRRATLLFAEGRKAKVNVEAKFVETALGAPRFLQDEVTRRPMEPGMAIGLAWTPVGGDVLFIESARHPGKGGLTVTGQLGDVMKESVTAALTWVRGHAGTYGIGDDLFETSQVHVHVPAGGTPKDGPSAGVTMVTALVSLFSGRRMRPRLAMTGEVTLTGQVLAVGGIKEKVLAAHRAGVRTVLMPKDNEKDYREDVPAEVRAEMKAHFIERAAEAVEIALAPANQAG